MNNLDFGELLRNTRQRVNLTQEQLASKLNVTSSAVSKWENGRNLPDREILLKLSELLHLTLEDIYHPRETLNRLETDSDVQNFTSENNSEPTHPAPVSKTFPFKEKRKGISLKTLGSISIVVIFISLLLGIFVFIEKQNNVDEALNVVSVAFRITEDEVCGTVYEVACVYSGDIDTLSNTSPYMFELSNNWINNTSVSQDITLMKVSFYPSEESAFQWESPHKSVYFAR